MVNPIDSYQFIYTKFCPLPCSAALEAVLGENFALGQNSWYTYTAETFQVAYITTCDPRNTTDPYVYSYDSYMYIYSDCEGTLLGENDDLEENACPYNRSSSGLILALNEGETIKIFFPWAFASAMDDAGFYFHIIASYPIVGGDVCETAIPLTLPVVNLVGTTVGFEDDYDLSPCSPLSNYMDGNEIVYRISLETDGDLTGNIIGAYGSIHVLDVCPTEELQESNCKGFVGGPNGGEFTTHIDAGDYYVIVSTWAPPQTVDYVLNMSFDGAGSTPGSPPGGGILDNIEFNVYPNPSTGYFTIQGGVKSEGPTVIKITNVLGQIVYDQQVSIPVGNFIHEVNLTDPKAGMYFLTIRNGTDVYHHSIMMEK